MAVPLEKLAQAVTPADPKDTAVRRAAAKLYGQGYTRSRVAMMICNHLFPNIQSREVRKRRANAVLKTWEAQESFRDTVAEEALQKLDLEIGVHLKALSSAAKRGRVDAAKLVLELTGRYQPRAEGQGNTIVLSMPSIPRPELNGHEEPHTVDGEATEVDAADD